MNRLIVLTGVSGAGISSSKSTFEEEGFFIVDNPPHEIIPALLQSFEKRSDKIHNFCLVLNISEMKESLEIIKKNKNGRKIAELIKAII